MKGLMRHVARTVTIGAAVAGLSIGMATSPAQAQSSGMSTNVNTNEVQGYYNCY